MSQNPGICIVKAIQSTLMRPVFGSYPHMIDERVTPYIDCWMRWQRVGSYGTQRNPCMWQLLPVLKYIWHSRMPEPPKDIHQMVKRKKQWRAGEWTVANILSSNFSREGGCWEDQQHGILGFWVGSSAIVCTFGLAAGSCSSLKTIIVWFWLKS